jgi:hypothetical protein
MSNVMVKKVEIWTQLVPFWKTQRDIYRYKEEREKEQ